MKTKILINFLLIISLMSCSSINQLIRTPSSTNKKDFGTKIKTKSCPARTTNLLKTVKKYRTKIKKRLAVKKPALWKRPIQKIRDWVRAKLIRLHKREYPVIAMDVVPEAMGWASHVTGVKITGETEDLTGNVVKNVKKKVKDPSDVVDGDNAANDVLDNPGNDGSDVDNDFLVEEDHDFDLSMLDDIPDQESSHLRHGLEEGMEEGTEEGLEQAAKNIGEYDFDEVQRIIVKKLDIVHNHKHDINRLNNKMINMQMELSTYRLYLKDQVNSPSKGKAGFDVLIPQIDEASTATNTIPTSRQGYMSSSKNLENKIAHLKKEINQLYEDIDTRELNQAIYIKELQTYRHELIRYAGGHENANNYLVTRNMRVARNGQIVTKDTKVVDAYGVINNELDPSVAKILNRIDALYDQPGTHLLKQEFRPASWTFQKLKWRSLKAEIWSIFKKDIPKLQEYLKLENQLKRIGITPQEKEEIERQLNKFKQLDSLIENMSDAEKEILGINKVERTVQSYRHYRWGRLIIPFKKMGATSFAGASGYASGGGGILFLYRWFRRKELKKQECIRMESSDEYKRCIREYLQMKFGYNQFTDPKVIDALFDDENKIVDKELQKEVKHIIKLRNQYTLSVHVRDTLIEPAVEIIDNNDILGDMYPERLSKIEDDKEFREKMLDPTPGVGFLWTKYHSSMRLEKVRRTVEDYLALGPDGNFDYEGEGYDNRDKARIILESFTGLSQQLAEDVINIFEMRSDRVNNVGLDETLDEEVEGLFDSEGGGDDEIDFDGF